MPTSFEEFKKLPPSSFDLEYGFLSLARSGFNKAESEMFAWAMLRAQQTQGDSWRPVELQQIPRVLWLGYYERRPEVLLLARRAFMGLTPVHLLRRGFLRHTCGEYLEWTDAGLEVLLTHFEKQGGSSYGDRGGHILRAVSAGARGHLSLHYRIWLPPPLRQALLPLLRRARRGRDGPHRQSHALPQLLF